VDKFLARFIDYINFLTEHLPEWKQASLIKKGPDMTKVRLLRGKNLVCFSATGLNIIGRIGYDLFNSDPPIEDWKPFAEKLATLKDSKGNSGWNKSNDLWK